MQENQNAAAPEAQGAGGIYVLTNPAAPDLVWIGCASDAEKRLEGLNRSQDMMADLQAPFRLHAVLETDVRVPGAAVHGFIDGVNPKLRAFPAADGDGRASRRPEPYRLSPEGACDVLKAFAAVKGLAARLRLFEAPVPEPPAKPALPKTAYAAESPAVPGWIRIGVCGGTLEEELESLNAAAGLPMPYRLRCFCSVPGNLDAGAFRKLAACLAPGVLAEGGAPFFRLSPEQAAGMLEAAAAFGGMADTLKICSPDGPAERIAGTADVMARMQDMARKADAGKLESMMESVLLGLAAGDALGVPYEFRKRGTFKASGMAEGGKHGQQAGTWSDDASLALAFADSLRPGGFDAEKAARNFQDWRFKGLFSARGEVFDVGEATNAAIVRMKQGVPPERAGGLDEMDNGNGSLMRIAPMALALLDVQEPEARYDAVRRASSLTHAHPLACACCFVFEEYLRLLAQGAGRREAYGRLCAQFGNGGAPFVEPSVLERLDRVLGGGLAEIPQRQIQSGGFAVHTLEAGLWCLLTSKDYAETVLKAVNLGDDADTTAAVAGAAAGLRWGKNSIPAVWTKKLAGVETLRRIARESAGRLAAGPAPTVAAAEEDGGAPGLRP